MGGRVNGKVVSFMSCDPAHKCARVSTRTLSPSVIVPSEYKMDRSAKWQSLPMTRFHGMVICTVLANVQPLPTFAPKTRRRNERQKGKIVHKNHPKVPQTTRRNSCKIGQAVRLVGGVSTIAEVRLLVSCFFSVCSIANPSSGIGCSTL